MMEGLSFRLNMLPFHLSRQDVGTGSLPSSEYKGEDSEMKLRIIEESNQPDLSSLKKDVDNSPNAYKQLIVIRKKVQAYHRLLMALTILVVKRVKKLDKYNKRISPNFLEVHHNKRETHWIVALQILVVVTLQSKLEAQRKMIKLTVRKIKRRRRLKERVKKDKKKSKHQRISSVQHIMRKTNSQSVNAKQTTNHTTVHPFTRKKSKLLSAAQPRQQGTLQQFRGLMHSILWRALITKTFKVTFRWQPSLNTRKMSDSAEQPMKLE
ncbi:hypothetical protein FGO68_gene925 [Halteria grandinella]|uniref:Uncharacterized protein n=1 Tax=Halteria grandinella TaxID=5974 RepID=A0A8J8NRD3_HALGN|nr:hypothetical protein FGO68_gene925 [Halteria grandinella]